MGPEKILCFTIIAMSSNSATYHGKLEIPLKSLNSFRCVIEHELKKCFQIALSQYATNSCTFQHDRKPQGKTRTQKCVGIFHHIQH